MPSCEQVLIGEGKTPSKHDAISWSRTWSDPGDMAVRGASRRPGLAFG
jgi:hypothetical protein